MTYSPGVENTTQSMLRFQAALPSLDKRFGFTYSLGFGQLVLGGLFIGNSSEAAQLLESAGLLQDLDQASPSPDSETAATYAYGLSLNSVNSYLELAGSVRAASISESAAVQCEKLVTAVGVFTVPREW